MEIYQFADYLLDVVISKQSMTYQIQVRRDSYDCGSRIF